MCLCDVVVVVCVCIRRGWRGGGGGGLQTERSLSHEGHIRSERKSSSKHK